MRKQEVRKQNRLRMLHVRHAGHWDGSVGLGLQQKRIQLGFEAALNFCGSVHDEQPKIGRNELVAAASRVQLPAEWSEFFDERFFDEVMHIFRGRAERFDPRGIPFGALRKFVQCCESLLHFCCRKNADGFKRLGPRTINGDFIGQETPVERKRTLERVELFVRFAFEASTPQPVVFASCHLALVEQAFLPVPVLSPSTIGRQTRMSVLLISFGLCFRPDRYRQREQIDKAFSVLGVVAAHGEAGQIGAVERER